MRWGGFEKWLMYSEVDALFFDGDGNWVLWVLWVPNGWSIHVSFVRQFRSITTTCHGLEEMISLPSHVVYLSPSYSCTTHHNCVFSGESFRVWSSTCIPLSTWCCPPLTIYLQVHQTILQLFRSSPPTSPHIYNVCFHHVHISSTILHISNQYSFRVFHLCDYHNHPSTIIFLSMRNSN